MIDQDWVSLIVTWQHDFHELRWPEIGEGGLGH
jgi:hypothetical protein